MGLDLPIYSNLSPSHIHSSHPPLHVQAFYGGCAAITILTRPNGLRGSYCVGLYCVSMQQSRRHELDEQRQSWQHLRPLFGSPRLDMPTRSAQSGWLVNQMAAFPHLG